MLIQAGICIVYLIKLFLEYKSVYEIRRYGILAFANMTCFCAVNEYKMISGGECREVALTVLFLTVICELYNLCNRYFASSGKNIVIVVALVLSLSWIISNIKEEFIFKYMTEKEGVYVEALDGNLTSLGDDLLATEQFLNGEKFFATYASAQEVVNGSFQPSGTDYIIHVLGDEQRENYLESFRNDDFKYVATMKESYTDWEYWVQRANWFFYRELYADWHPVYANSYEIYWEKNSTEGENIVISGFDLEIVDVDESSKKIVVNCDENLNGIADVYMEANVMVTGGITSRLVFSKNIKVENTGVVYADNNGSYYESNYLRPETHEYIPIPIINGYGEVTVTSNPTRNTLLTIDNVSCERIFTVTSDLVQITGTLLDGSGRVVFIVVKSEKNINAIADLKTVELDGNTYGVLDIVEDDNVMYIFTDNDTDIPIIESGQENYLRLMR
jgi:hypothetical protein